MHSFSRSNSICSLSSTTSEAEDTMQIFVKNVTGETMTLTVPTSTTISALRHLISLRTNLPTTDLRLVHAGKHLQSSVDSDPQLSDYHIGRESTIHLALPLRGGVPKKLRCTFKDCKDAAQRIVGDCGFCSGRFCGKHRLLEDHKCPNLEDCKRESHQQNADKLNSERTVAIKGI